MSLQQRKQTERKFKSINLDISILNGLARPSGALKDIDAKPKAAKLSMNELSNILINKNKKLSPLQGQKKQAIEWLKQKGLDWRKVNLQIGQNAIIAEQQAALTRQKRLQARGIQSVIGIKAHIPQQPQRQAIFTKEMQDEFISRQKQVHLCKVIMKSLAGTKHRSNTRLALMGKIRGEEVVGKESEVIGQVDGKREVGEEVIRNQYFDFVRALAVGGFDGSMNLLKKIRPFWRIALQHIKTIQHYAPQLYSQSFHQQIIPSPSQPTTTTQYDLRMNQYLMIKSLKLIQRQFQKSLPDVGYSFEKLDEMVREMERRNRRLRVWRNSNGEATWAVTFMLLRAGRINEIKRVLESVDRDILRAIITHNLSINSQKPQKSLKQHDLHKYNDTFYTQIVRILSGTPTFDKQIFTASTNQPYLTRVWILLITIGIYRSIPQMNDNFQTLNDNIIGQECNATTEPIDEVKIEQYLYMGNYKKFIYMMEMILIENKLPQKSTSSFTYDDYFHLMVVLVNYPQMWGASSGKQLVGLQGKFVQVLIHYMKKLRYEKNKPQLPYYLMLGQGEKLQMVATNLITTANEYQEFDWRTLRDVMMKRDPKDGLRLFKQLSKAVLDSLSLTKFNDFLFAAEAYHVDFEGWKDSWYLQQKCYVKLLLGYLYFLEGKRHLLRSNMPTQDFNFQMHHFFSIDQQQNNQSSLSQRDYQIRRKVKQCEDKLEFTIDMNSTDQEYVSNIIIPFGFYKKFSRFIKLLENEKSTVEDLKAFDTQWTKGLNKQQKHEFQEGAQPVLLRFLGLEFPSQNYSNLYVYYLNEVISRKRMLCSIDCDYTGVITQLRQIAGLLRHLQAYYQRKLLELRRSEGRIFGQEKRMLTEEATNPLKDSEEYRKLKEAIKEMVGEDVEVRVLEEGVAGLGMKEIKSVEDKRREIKQRYSASEYFGQEVGY